MVGNCPVDWEWYGASHTLYVGCSKASVKSVYLPWTKEFSCSLVFWAWQLNSPEWFFLQNMLKYYSSCSSIGIPFRSYIVTLAFLISHSCSCFKQIPRLLLAVQRALTSWAKAPSVHYMASYLESGFCLLVTVSSGSKVCPNNSCLGAAINKYLNRYGLIALLLDRDLLPKPLITYV